jgi:glycosyltransferase involved in cell wall biosynthesis
LNNKHDAYIRAINRKPPYSILTGATHERYETNLCRTGHDFYSYTGEGFKSWNTIYGPVPANYYILEDKGWIPDHCIFDIILSQNKYSQFQHFKPMADNRNVLLISLEHTWPADYWTHKELAARTNMRGDVNVFISKKSAEQWGFDPNDPTVEIVHHGVDNETFKPTNKERSNKVGAVVNDWINRDYFCGYKIWQEATKDLEVSILGNTPGLSRAAKDADELCEFYNTIGVFVNTAPRSPIPTVLLEAMACGCPVVSLRACAVPDIIVDGENGLLGDNPKEIRDAILTIQNDKRLAEKLGKAARATIDNHFSLEKHIGAWNNLLSKTIGKQHNV